MEIETPQHGNSVKITVWLCAALVLAGAGVAAVVYGYLNDPLRRTYGSEGVWILESPERVEAHRLAAVEQGHEIFTLTGFPVANGPESVDLEVARGVASVLLQHTTDRLPTSCGFNPGVRLDFVRDGRRLQVLFCFECNSIRTFANGPIVGGDDFDSTRAELVRAMKAIFPADEQIQSLSEKR